ncbi:MAG: tRNA epoxyqueuosine(34) reductase QueG [bacterium]
MSLQRIRALYWRLDARERRTGDSDCGRDGMERADLARIVKQEAISVGFDLVGITTAEPPESAPRYLDWIRNGYHGDMDYMARNANVRLDPRALLPDARSVIVVGLNYAPGEISASRNKAAVSRYAWGDDYHEIMRSRMKDLCRRIRERTRLSFATRICVDTAPLLERDFARRAGLGWIGKNTSLINRRFGTWLFLGAILVNLELPPDTPVRDYCGICKRCLDACPTKALVAPRVLDARRCISYLTIESKGSIPRDLRPAVGNCLFGCDECLAACPWNRFASATKETAFTRRNEAILLDPAGILSLTDEEFKQRFAFSPLLRAGRAGLARNAAIVLGNLARDGIPSLCKALSDPEPTVRLSAAWALGQFPQESAARALRETLVTEEDEEVRVETQEALQDRVGGA